MTTAAQLTQLKDGLTAVLSSLQTLDTDTDIDALNDVIDAALQQQGIVLALLADTSGAYTDAQKLSLIADVFGPQS